MLAFQLAVLCLVSDVFASGHPPLLPRLLPVHLPHYEHITGFQRRSIDRRWDTEPQHQAQLIWGLRREEDSFTLANMTLQAPPDLPIVLLERFDYMTDDVDCKGDDGEISLTFKSEYAFRQASDAWRYINDHEDHRFLVIANHEGCGPGEDRQPYIVTNVQEEPESLTTRLASHPIELHEVAHNFELHFGEFRPSQSPLARRGVVDTTNWCNFVGPCPQLMGAPEDNRADGLGWKNKDAPYEINWQAENTQIFGLGDILQVYCKQCQVVGKFITSGTAFIKNRQIVASTVTANVQNFKSQFPISIEGALPDMVKSAAPDMHGKDITLVDLPIPGAGFSLGNVASFGANIEIGAGLHASFKGKFSAGVTFQGSTEDSAVTMDLLKVNHNKFDGASSFNLEKPEWSVRKFAQTAKVNANFGLKATLGFKLGSDGSLGQARAEILLPLPLIALKLTPAFRSRGDTAGLGFCAKDFEDGGGGVEVEGIFTTQITGKVIMNPPAVEEVTFWTRDFEMPKFAIPFPKVCIPFSLKDSQSDSETGDESVASAGTGDEPSNSEAGDDGANADDDTTTNTAESYNLSDDVLGLHSDQSPDNNFADNQGVQLADNLGTPSQDASPNVAEVPPTYQLSNDYLGVQGNQQSDLFAGSTQGIQLADSHFGTQSPSSENNLPSTSEALGSLPSNTGSSGSDTNYQAFAPNQNTDQNTDQYTAALQSGGVSNTFASGGVSNTGSSIPNQASTNANANTDTLMTSSGNDKFFGA